MVPLGYELDIFADNYFKGTPKTIDGKLKRQEKNNFELQCQEIPDAITSKKRYGSIRIKSKKTGRVTGYWKGITSSENLTYTFSVGITSTEANSSAEKSAATMKASLSSGWDASVSAGASVGFMGNGVSVSGSAGKNGSESSSNSVEASLAREISSTAGVDKTTTYQTTCTPKKDEGAGLWQWVLSTSDYGTSAFTAHTVCRTGKLARTPPNCSFDDCEDDQCEICKSDKIIGAGKLKKAEETEGDDESI